MKNRKTKPNIKTCPTIEGFVTIQLIDNGKVVRETCGSNIWTSTGREFLSELISLRAFSTIETDRELVRNDRVAYIGMGIGTQPEVSNITSLVDPVAYDTGTTAGEYLAVLDTPCEYPSAAAVQFSRTFGANELSVITPSNPTGAIVITEAGLFTDGDPANNFIVGTIGTSYASASRYAPVAYKTFEPITKTPQYTMKVIWEVRFI